ncbi:DUF4116 domain-containing protein, partial [Gammaproteobacteria bacterium]|nr:DUF4116 domain-containing protein [Gammaproteobacteria bacterium]
AVKSSGYALQYADKKLKADKEVVLAAVQQNVSALQYADKKLQADKEVVLAAVKQDGFALDNADKKLQADKEVVIAAVQENVSALQFADKKLLADKEVVLAVVKQEGNALDYADKKLQADKEVVLAAVKQSGWALEYADKKLQDDKEVVLAAVKSSGFALEYADKKLQADKEVVLAAVKSSGAALQYADKKLQKDKDVIQVIEQHIEADGEDSKEEMDESDDFSEKCASYLHLASEAEDDLAPGLYSKAADFVEFAVEWWDDFGTIASSGELDKKSLAKLFEKWRVNLLENRGNLGNMEKDDLYSDLISHIEDYGQDKKFIELVKSQQKDTYTIETLDGPFGAMREGDGKVVYFFSQEVDYDACKLVVSSAYNSFVLDEDGEISRNWAEYDPSQLTTKIAGDIEDELDFSEIANKIGGDDSNSVKLEAFVNELLENNIPCVFVNTKQKLITQINSENVNIILDCLDNLKVFVREYDYAGDY